MQRQKTGATTIAVFSLFVWCVAKEVNLEHIDKESVVTGRAGHVGRGPDRLSPGATRPCQCVLSAGLALDLADDLLGRTLFTHRTLLC